MTYSFSGPSSSRTLIKKVESPYTPREVIQWLESIGYRHELTESDIASGRFQTTLENLHVLNRLHLVAFPFENCDMHYTSDHSMDVTPQGMFRCAILRGRGSYSFGLNTLFLGMLRGLGYRAYAGSARVNESSPRKLGPLSHMILLVQPDSETHFQPVCLVDVGFGGTCLTRPIYLRDCAIVMGATSSEKHRLIRAPHPSSSMDSQDSALLWHLQISRSGKSESSWKTLYAFSESESFPEDFMRASVYISQIPSESIFWKNLICVRYFVVDGEEQRRLGLESRAKDVHLGKYILFGNEIRRSVGSCQQVLQTFRSEEDRIQALRDYFGFDIDDKAVCNIVGRAAALAACTAKAKCNVQ
ncbi:cysteine proteinase [Desarmillaria tabescens]|uniref:Cysteine proteinase n=1 Tax=Armillaria tabescens TaxID=1929756 RepID=A0AA39NP95_ARMTA|nr:cysteine proteinase [Desarmillaria tabescens]KAK0469337.1 cysteine proteinase [Desarmillaria tabescens]